MIEKSAVRKNEYYDSVTLMTLSNKIKKIEGIIDAVISMATPMNIELLQSIGLSNEEIIQASVNDLLIAIRAENEEICEEALLQIESSLNKKGFSDEGEKKSVYYTISQAKKENPDYNVAVISVAGHYAAREARLALENKMHVMLFSDNVTVEEELQLKELAHNEGLLVMGPDCGTAILDGVGLCFANKVRRGNIGLAAASGTGLQEVSVLIDKLGEGISQAIGVGGRDLSAEIGGIMMLDALHLLEKDVDTKVIVLISKPPVKEVADKILDKIRDCEKPVVVCFIGSDADLGDGSICYAANLEDAAVQAIKCLKGRKQEANQSSIYPISNYDIQKMSVNLADSQQYIRGLYCGGTLVADALSVMSNNALEVYSNVAKRQDQKMKDPMKSNKHTLVDLGDDIFTLGRPHPMIEPEIRNERLFREATDPETAVLLLDFELGFGSHENPVGVTIEAIQKAKEENKKSGLNPVLVAYILGTDQDFQGYDLQRTMLEAEGILVADSNLHAIEIALEVIQSRR